MRKKGFTLVELLAVIAILALLIIIALPNIMSLFNSSKKESFTTEIKTIARAAEQQWMNDSMFETNDMVYARVQNETCSKSLKLSGRDEINYYIKINKNGNITKYYATDGTYQYGYTGKGLKVEDIIDIETIAFLPSEEDKVSINCTNGIISYQVPKKCLSLTFITRQNSESLTPGDEVSFAGEKFFVVSSNFDDTIFFTKYSIDILTNSQNQAARGVTFSDTGYWDKCQADSNVRCTTSSSGLLSTYGTNYSAYVYDEHCNAYPYINLYTEKLSNLTGIEMVGKLISSNQFNTLKNYNEYGAQAVKNNGGYWLGNVINYGSPQWTANDGYIDFTLYTLSHAIRPIIYVDTSDICN